ncbi:MAG: hypothetical protein QOJ99_2615 [Bryobacterales bacterium]|nr:hypothetical protein [Bryobacterales bacterium]
MLKTIPRLLSFFVQGPQAGRRQLALQLRAFHVFAKLRFNPEAVTQQRNLNFLLPFQFATDALFSRSSPAPKVLRRPAEDLRAQVR